MSVRSPQQRVMPPPFPPQLCVCACAHATTCPREERVAGPVRKRVNHRRQALHRQVPLVKHVSYPANGAALGMHLSPTAFNRPKHPPLATGLRFGGRDLWFEVWASGLRFVGRDLDLWFEVWASEAVSQWRSSGGVEGSGAGGMYGIWRFGPYGLESRV